MSYRRSILSLFANHVVMVLWKGRLCYRVIGGTHGRIRVEEVVETRGEGVTAGGIVLDDQKSLLRSLEEQSIKQSCL